MVAEEEMKETPGAAGRRGTLREGLSDFTEDLFALVELQMQLLREDARGMARRVGVALLLLAGAAITVFACLPVVILGLAELLALTGLARGTAMLIVAAVFAVASAGIGLWGWSLLKHAAEPLRRSQREFLLNLESVKRALRSRNHNGEQRFSGGAVGDAAAFVCWSR